jgi:hypothetical protein
MTFQPSEQGVARMPMKENGRKYVLELNSVPSLDVQTHTVHMNTSYDSPVLYVRPNLKSCVCNWLKAKETKIHKMTIHGKFGHHPPMHL